MSDTETCRHTRLPSDDAAIDPSVAYGGAERARSTRGMSAEPIYTSALSILQQFGSVESALDYGAGTGTFTQELIVRGVARKVVAVDLVRYSERFEHPCVDWCTCDLEGRVPLPSGACDLVVALEVIEHLENPRAAARDWYQLLRPGGTVLVSTPNNASVRSIISLCARGYFAAFGPANYPKHLTALSPCDLCRVMAEAGFHEIKLEDTDHGAVPGLTRFSWQALSIGVLRGQRFSDNVLCLAQKAGAGSRT